MTNMINSHHCLRYLHKLLTFKTTHSPALASLSCSHYYPHDNIEPLLFCALSEESKASSFPIPTNKIDSKLTKSSNYSKRAAKTTANIGKPTSEAFPAEETYDCTGPGAGIVGFVPFLGMVPLSGTTLTTPAP